VNAPPLGLKARSAARDFGAWRGDFASALSARFSPADVEAILADAHRSFHELLDRMPDPGWRAPPMRAFSRSGALYVAFYLVLRPRRVDAQGAWAVCDQATRRHFARMSGLERRLASRGLFSALMQWLVRSLERRSRRSPVDG
jgi:hypothetical protein